MESRIETFAYDDEIVRKFLLVTVLWGVVGMLVGILIALQLAYWPLNMGMGWLTFGRLRPLHTNAVIFAFAGNTIFAGIYYSLQRLLKARMFSDTLSKTHFWGWQLIIVLAAVTLPLGITVSKEYAELEWPIDILITLVWVVFAVNVFGTLANRRERHIYVAVWFYIATIVTVAMLHIVNSLAFPVSFFQSYSIYAGVQDALVQWWYGHNAVAFFLTTPFLGLMYYFVPKAAGRPVYSYRLSIVHFWSLIFLYIWTGPHHLLYSSLPEWAQTIGTVFSIMLIAPSWGGMINGLLTLRGAWDKLRADPVLKFFVAAITFYGMSTFEGPMMSIKAVNSLTHFTDYTIGHVHGGALGWNGFMAFGMIYYLLPRLWRTAVWSSKLTAVHFWSATAGIVLYMISMWSAGITQSLMWRAFKPDGTLLYPQFIETVTTIVPFYWMRVFGGALYFIGTMCCAVNVWMTVRAAKAAQADLSDPQLSAPAMTSVTEGISEQKSTWHRKLEGMPVLFTALVLASVFIGGPATYIPLIAVKSNIPTIPSVKPYTALELEGRDIYISEGCYNCHSQLVRPFRDEVVRYAPKTGKGWGEYSKSGETVYDHPFQFGSKRTGPDLAREGGKYPNSWHYFHMIDPRKITPESIMPAYPWLAAETLDTTLTVRKVSVMRSLGAPYADSDINNAMEDLTTQAKTIAADLENSKAAARADVQEKKVTALIAYLQRLGLDIRAK